MPKQSSYLLKFYGLFYTIAPLPKREKKKVGEMNTITDIYFDVVKF